MRLVITEGVYGGFFWKLVQGEWALHCPTSSREGLEYVRAVEFACGTCRAFGVVPVEVELGVEPQTRRYLIPLVRLAFGEGVVIVG